MHHHFGQKWLRIHCGPGESICRCSKCGTYVIRIRWYIVNCLLISVSSYISFFWKHKMMPIQNCLLHMFFNPNRHLTTSLQCHTLQYDFAACKTTLDSRVQVFVLEGWYLVNKTEHSWFEPKIERQSRGRCWFTRWLSPDTAWKGQTALEACREHRAEPYKC